MLPFQDMYDAVKRKKIDTKIEIAPGATSGGSFSHSLVPASPAYGGLLRRGSQRSGGATFKRSSVHGMADLFGRSSLGIKGGRNASRGGGFALEPLQRSASPSPSYAPSLADVSIDCCSSSFSCWSRD